jgi:tRNA (cytidine/uridine-2'-O-)-methyltransferase
LSNSLLEIPRHRLSIGLLQTQIAPNTGNIARLCVATGTDLHLVRPFGFVLSDRQLRRSAMDYWPRVRLTLHDSSSDFVAFLRGRRFWLFDSSGATSLWNASFQKEDVLVFGSETRGIDPAILGEWPERTVRLPQVAGERCLNLSTAAGAAIYEAIRQCATKHIPIQGGSTDS